MDYVWRATKMTDGTVEERTAFESVPRVDRKTWVGQQAVVGNGWWVASVVGIDRWIAGSD